jgi:phosphoglycolate phosphatase-like HAD superfamily hydrolase
MIKSAFQLLHNYPVIFWDFDGVVKESVEVKSLAYQTLFKPFGQRLASKVREHHESNGGVSRFDKIPLYLSWAGEPATPSQVGLFCKLFSETVKSAVIDAPWVAGVRDYLMQNYTKQYFVLVTATPQEEIEEILAALDLAICFREVYGAPTKKTSAIRAVLSLLQYPPDRALMIGDSVTDQQAAHSNSVPFMLRRTPFNLPLQDNYSGPMFDHLNHE